MVDSYNTVHDTVLIFMGFSYGIHDNSIFTCHPHTCSQMEQEAFEKCWAHSPLRAAACPNITFPFTRFRYGRTPLLSHAAAHRCPRQRQQRQCVTEGTAMAPWNGPNETYLPLPTSGRAY